MASPTLISKSIKSDCGTNSKKPDVGFGVVGRNTEIICSPTGIFWLTSPFVVVEINATAQIPLRGYSTRQTLSNDVSDWANTVSANCFKPL